MLILMIATILIVRQLLQPGLSYLPFSSSPLLLKNFYDIIIWAFTHKNVASYYDASSCRFVENHGIIQQISTTRRPIVKQRCVLALRDVVSCLCIKALSNEAKETNIKTSMCASVVLPSNATGSEMVSKLKANSRWLLFNHQDFTRPTAGQSSVRIRSLGLQFLRFSPTMENRPLCESSKLCVRIRKMQI